MEMQTPIPPGLEYLTQLDQVLVQQQYEIFELLAGCEMNNKYILKNSVGQEWLKAKEDTDCLTRQCCGPLRCFEMSLFDNQERAIIHLSRPLACVCCCCPTSCLQSMEVQCPPGTVIGNIRQEWSFCTPYSGKFVIQNPSGDTVLRIQGPCCPVSCGSDVDFSVMTGDNSIEIGKITKQWRGFCAEALTDADNFGVTFPMDLEVRTKALIIGAMFLIDFMYFERQNNN